MRAGIKERADGVFITPYQCNENHSSWMRRTGASRLRWAQRIEPSISGLTQSVNRRLCDNSKLSLCAAALPGRDCHQRWKSWTGAGRSRSTARNQRTGGQRCQAWPRWFHILQVRRLSSWRWKPIALLMQMPSRIDLCGNPIFDQYDHFYLSAIVCKQPLYYFPHAKDNDAASFARRLLPVYPFVCNNFSLSIC